MSALIDILLALALVAIVGTPIVIAFDKARKDMGEGRDE